jgi:hypothetical protein
VLNRLYLTSGVAVLIFYVLSVVNGWEFGNPRPELVPPDVRHSPGGYRAFHFWHSGYHGGK